MSPSRGRQALPPRVHDTAAEIMDRAVPVVEREARVSDIRRKLLKQRFDTAEIVVVVDEDGAYAGAAAIGDVLATDGQSRVSELLHKDWPAVHPQWSQEHAAQAAVTAGVSCLPVISDKRRPLGCIPAARLLSVLGREHREDVHRLVGMLREREGARHALEDPPLRRVSQRLPWLLVGLVLSTAGTALMASYEEALQANIAIAFFIPSLVYLTDAIGTQTEAIAVRGLSLRRRWSLASILSSEIVTGTMIGMVLGALAFLGVLAVFRDLALAESVGIAMIIASAIASAIGLMLPWALSRLGIDPAFGSGPVATIVQDTLTILVYFLVTAHLMSG
jgi:magnesium transporter